MKKLIFYLFLIMLIACQKEAEEESMPIDPNCDKTTFESLISELEEAEHFLLMVEEKVEDYLLIFENGVQIRICQSLINGFTFNEEAWNATFSYADGTSVTMAARGHISTDFRMDPYGFNPLCARVNVKASRPGKVRIRIKGRHGADSDLIKTFDKVGTVLEIPVFGLYENYNNLVELTFTTTDDKVIDIDTLMMPTPPITRFDPKIEILHIDRVNMEPGEFHLVSTLSFWNPNIVYMFDTYGHIRWMIDYTDSPLFRTLLYDVGMERLPNGNFYFGNITTSSIYEVDMYGRLVNSWDMQGYIFHHNVQVKPDGNFLINAEDPNSIHLNGQGTAEDYVIEIDRQSGNIVKVWDFKQILDENRLVMGEFYDMGNVDWLHINAVIYDPSDETIIISGRHQGLIKVDYDDNVKWVIAPHEGWGENRLGQDCNDFLLTAVNNNQSAYNNAIQNGFENADDFEWAWYQHAPMLMPNGNVMVFDNGPSRNFDNNNEKYSRAVEYKINEEARTIQQVWQYGKERGPETHATIISDVDYLPQTGNILFSPGFEIFNGQEDLGGRIIELDYDTKEVYFEAYIGSGSLTFHRVERMPMYAD